MAENGTVAYVESIPTCDIHGGHPAVYDASIAVAMVSGQPSARRIWANVCQEAFDEFDGHLGTGRGQRFELRNGTNTQEES